MFADSPCLVESVLKANCAVVFADGMNPIAQEEISFPGRLFLYLHTLGYSGFPKTLITMHE